MKLSELRASFHKYPAYKDSGVEWLGEVPEEWELIRLGTRFSERKMKVSDKDFPPLSVTKNGIVPQLDNAAKSNDGENRKLVKEGDFVINSRSDRKGSSGIAFEDGSVSLINIVMTPKEIYPTFCNYLLKSTAFVEENYRIGHGIVADLWTTRYDEMKNIKVAIPSTLEQSAIANFLDNKTAKIDLAIAQKEKMIALLKERKQIIIQNAVTGKVVWSEKEQKMVPLAQSEVERKDSGVEWIGEIPSHWEVKKLKYLTSIQGGFAFDSSDFKEEGIQIIKIANTYMNRLSLERQPTFVDPSYLISHKEWVVSKNDILMSLTGTLGKKDYGFAIIIENEEKYLLNQRVAKLNVKKNSIEPAYLLTILHSESYLNQLYSLPSGTKQANLSNDNVINIQMPVPPKEERDSILDWIRNTKYKIDSAIALQQTQIQKLKEYKSTLIDNAVTGKIKVPGI